MFIMYVMLLIILPAIITFCVEWLQIQDIQMTLDWIGGHCVQVLLGYCLILLIFFIIYMVSCRLSIAMLGTSSIFIILAMVNYYKLIMRGEPFMPWDLMLNKEASNIMAYIDLSINRDIMLMLGILLITIIALAFIKPKKLKAKFRVLGVFAGVSITIIFMNKTYFNSENMKILGVEDVFWNQKRNYEINGFFHQGPWHISNMLKSL